MRDQITSRINEVAAAASERYTDTNDKVLDIVVDVNRKVVEIAVKTADRVLDAVNERLDDVKLPDVKAPSFNVPSLKGSVKLPLADRLDDVELPKFDMPEFEMPTPTEVGERYMAFVDRAVALNRDFSERVAKMIAADQPAAKKTVKTAKPAARKSAARKATTRKPAAKKATPKRTAKKPVATTTA